MDSLPLHGNFGIAIRLNSLNENGINFEKIRNLMENENFEENNDLVIFSPIFGKEAMEELSRRLSEIGLQYFDDFFELEFVFPEWCQLKLQYSRTVV